MPRLEICEQCGKHGRIVLADGQIGPEFSFVQHGIEFIENGINMGIFSTAEGRALEEALVRSAMPVRWQDQDLRVIWLTNKHNRLQMKGVATEADRHAFLHRPIKRKKIPAYFAAELERRFTAH